MIVCFGSLPAAGQDIHGFSQFFFNPSLLNPSFTGIDAQSSAILSYRKQWLGIQGAPVMANFSFQSAGKKRLAFGVHASSATAGLLKASGVRISSGYNIPAGDGRYFRFGMAAGASWNRVDVAGMQFGSPDPDPVTGSLMRSSTGILAAAGFSYHTKSFHAGVSAPAMVEPDQLAADAFSKGTFKPLDNLIFHTSYRIYLNDKQSVIDSYLNYRVNKFLPSQLELAGVAHLKGRGWIGASWKQGLGVSGLAGIHLSNTFAVGYAYSLKGSGPGELGVPSHEVQLGILFGQRFKGNPSYSFINSEKDSRAVRKPGMVASAGKKPAAKGYVPLQKGAAIAKGGPQKPLPPKPAVASKPQPQQKPTVAPAVAKVPPVTPPVSKPASEVVSQPAITEKKAPEPAVTSPSPAPPQVTKPVVAEKSAEKPVDSKPAATPIVEKPVAEIRPAAPTIKETAVTAVPAVKETAKPAAEPVALAKPAEKLPVIQAQPTVAEVPAQEKKPEVQAPAQPENKPAVANVKAPDKSQGRPRLTQSEGLFDEQLPGEPARQPEKVVTREEPEVEEGEDVAGLHGTRHVQDSLQEADEQERLGRLNLHNDDPKAEHLGEAPHAERHEFVRRGGHQAELSVGDYVIVGVFKTEVNARRWADGLKAMGFKDINHGFLSERTVWYVHFAGINDLQQARSVRNEYRKLKVFRDAWLLTVQE